MKWSVQRGDVRTAGQDGRHSSRDDEYKYRRCVFFFSEGRVDKEFGLTSIDILLSECNAKRGKEMEGIYKAVMIAMDHGLSVGYGRDLRT